MTWTTPTHVSAGEADSGKFNDETVDNLLHLYDQLNFAEHSARAYRNAALSIGAASSTTLIAMDTESWDPGANFDTGSGRYTVPVTGYYDVRGQVNFNLANNPDDLQLGIYVGATLRSAGGRNVYRGGSAGDDVGLVVSDIISVTAGELIDIRVEHFTGASTCGLNVGNGTRNYITINRVPTP